VERDEFKDGSPNEITKLADAETKTNIDEPSNSNPPQWRPNAGPEDFRRQRVVERPAVDGRTAERTMCPEVSSMADSEAAKSTQLGRRRGLWDEDETTVRSPGGEGRRVNETKDANPPKSCIRSETLGERHQKRREARNVDPLDSDEVDDNRRSPDMFASPPHPDSTYYMATTERVRTRRTSGGPKEQRSNTATKSTKSSRKDKGNAKADSIRHSPSSSERSTQKTKERKILEFATSELEEGESRQRQSNSRPKERSRPKLSKSSTPDEDSGFEEDPSDEVRSLTWSQPRPTETDEVNSVEENPSPMEDEVYEVYEVDEVVDEVRVLQKPPSGTSDLAGESLHILQ